MSHRLDKHAVQFRAIGARGEYHVESRGLALWFREKYRLARVECMCPFYGVGDWTDVTDACDWLRVEAELAVWARTWREHIDASWRRSA